MLRVKNKTTKDTKINCILRFLRGKIETNIDDVKLSEVDIINSTISVPSHGEEDIHLVKSTWCHHEGLFYLTNRGPVPLYGGNGFSHHCHS